MYSTTEFELDFQEMLTNPLENDLSMETIFEILCRCHNAAKSGTLIEQKEYVLKSLDIKLFRQYMFQSFHLKSSQPLLQVLDVELGVCCSNANCSSTFWTRVDHF
jgi:hypothetical protein